ncbi:TPR-like protein [Coprinopsis marcescibilis]|uniref:TPR-like protein n=1 Tax=Coprinopsis marcescibilis TaxID=230819 RepID=A0A5C3KAN4_COPMA|nr:TPR-like protein [Coprinopsis marcescibilis]
MDKLRAKVERWRLGEGSQGSRKVDSAQRYGSSTHVASKRTLPVAEMAGSSGEVINPTHNVLPDILNATIHGSHLQTAERIDNTYNFYGDNDVNQALQLLGNPKGCAWDPSRACLDGTRLIHIDAIVSWATSLEMEPATSGARILLVPGPAGSGKSALAHTICEQLDQKGLLVCSVFFDATGQQPTAEDFTVALILGLSSINDSVKKAIAEIIVENRTLASASALRQLKDIILPIMPKLPANRNFVVGIDALDEQPNPVTLQLLQEHVPRLPSTFRFVLTTRPTRQVMQYLENRPHIISFPHRLVGDTSNTDVKIYITFRLSKTNYSDTVSHGLLVAFIAKSEGLFLWAETVLNHIDNAFNHAAELSDIIAGASSYWTEAETAVVKLERLYEHILSKLEWKDRRFVEKFNIVVGALVTLQEPLSRHGLAALYSPDGITEDDVHGICMLIRPLLQNYSVDDKTQPIHLLHLSVQEYLIQRAPQPFRIDSGVHHDSLTRLCLLTIRRELTPENVPILGYSDGDWVWDVAEKRPEIPVLLSYSFQEALWYSIQHFDAHWGFVREKGNKRLTVLIHEIVVENPRPILEVVASTRSMIDIVSFQCKVLPHSSTSLAHARCRAKIYISLATCLLFQDRRMEALPLSQEAVELYATCNPANCLDFAVALEFATSLALLGDCLYGQDRVEEALPHVEEALAISRQLALTHTCEARPALVHSLGTKGDLLSEIGRHDEACEVELEVVDLYRQLLVDQPEKFQPPLAWALRKLAWNLVKCNKPEEAVTVTLEEIECRRKTISHEPDTRAHLHDSLERHARHLGDAKRLPEAHKAVQETLEIRRALADEDPKPHNQYLADSFHTAAIRFDNCGRAAEAIPFLCKAIAIYRQLVTNDPSTFEPSLSSSLHNHALYLDKIGRTAEVVECCQEVVDIRRRLVDNNPGKYNLDLANSLASLAIDLDNCGRAAEAIPFSCEAIAVYRRLAANDPCTFNRKLSKSLHNHGIYLYKIGRSVEAVEYCQEAVDIRRRLVDNDPGKYNPDLANSLLNFATCIDTCGRAAEAIPFSCEAIAMYRQLAENDPSILPRLCYSLHNHSSHLDAIGRTAEAVEYCKEAVDIWRRLVDNDPGKYNPDLASSLENMAHYLNDCGRIAEAIPFSCEAIALYRQLVANDPSASESGLSDALYSHSLYLDKIGRTAEAVGYCREAVDIRRRLVDNDPSKHNPDLADSLLYLAYYLYNCGRAAEAIPLSCEAIALYRQLVANDPSTFEPGLSRSLHHHAFYLDKIGRTAEAAECSQEAGEIKRRIAQSSPEEPDLVL